MAKNRIERTISALLFLAIIAALMVWWDAWNLAHKRDVTAIWPNPTFAVRNSACPAQTGVFLVACDYRGNFIHYSDIKETIISPEDRILVGDLGRATDDIGQAFFVNMIAAISGEVQRVTKVGQINFYINLMGLLIIWILVFRFSGLMGNIVLLMIGLISVNEKLVVPWYSIVQYFINTTSHGAFFGVSVLSLLPAICLIELSDSLRSRGFYSRLKIFLLCLVSVLGFSIAALMRESLALSGFVALLVAAAFICYRSEGWRKMLVITPVVVITYVILKLQIIVTIVGQWKYNLLPPETVVGHGMVFSLVTGLGVVPNSLGLKGTDLDSIDLMASLHPHLVYGFKNFYSTLADWYLQTLLSNPFEILRIYWVKFYYIMVHSGNGLMMLISILLFWRGYRLFNKSNEELVKHKYFLYGTVFATMLVMVITQGVLVFIFDHYLFPIYIFLSLFFSIGIGRIYPLRISRHS